MRSFMITTVLAALATLAIGSTIPTAANLTNAMKWVGPSKGVNVTLYGRADEIVSQLKALDSEWIPAPQRPGYVAPTGFNRSSELSSRSEENHICCPVLGQSFVPVNPYYLQTAAQDLINIGGACLTEPGCALAVHDSAGSQAACFNGAGIVLCNPTVSEAIGSNCADVGHETMDLINDCLGVNGNSVSLGVCGQLFDTKNYNIIATNC